jgi:predicted metal-dependent RNase
MKKVNGSLKQSHYEVIDYDTGEVVDLKPEYKLTHGNAGGGLSRHIHHNERTESLAAEVAYANAS